MQAKKPTLSPEDLFRSRLDQILDNKQLLILNQDSAFLNFKTVFFRDDYLTPKGTSPNNQ